MKNILKIVSIDLIILAGLFTALSFIFIIPKFEKYNSEIVNITKTPEKYYIYKNDTDNDGNIEQFVLLNTKDDAFIEFTSKSLLQQINLEYNFFGTSLTFGDYDKDGIKEIAFLSQNADSILLSILKFEKGNWLFIIENRFVTKIAKNYKGNYDTKKLSFHLFYDTNNDGFNDFIFSILSQYSYQPRGFYVYDIKADKVKQTEKSGMYILGPGFVDFDSDGIPEIYFSTAATGNASSEFSHVNYPDTSCWLMAYDLDLKAIFEPIQISNKYHDIRVQPIQTKDSVFMAVLSTNGKTVSEHELSIYNSTGQKLKSRNFEYEYFNNPNMLSNSAPNFDNIYIFDQDGYIYIFNSDLEQIEKKKLVDSKTRNNIVYAGYDVTGNGKKELIYSYYKGLIIFQNNFEKLIEIEIEYPAFKKPSFYTQDGKRMINFEVKNNLWYLVAISNNQLYNIRHIIYIFYFLLLYGILYLIKYIWLRKLKQDNIKLNILIEERTKKIKQQNLKLKEEAKFKEALSSMLIHDLKSPLQSIISLSNRKKDKNNQQLEVYTNQMLSLVMNILDVQKYENTKLKLNLSENYLYQCCESAINKVQILAEQKNIRIYNNIPKNFNPQFDFNIIERVFINLLSNAIKFSYLNKSVEINYESVIQSPNNYCKITIKDQGKGIEQKIQTKLFNKYQHGEDKVCSHSTGLGLFYCKTVINEHGGGIGADSEKNKGSEFWFTLPCRNSSKIKSVHLTEKKSISSHFFSNFTENEKDIIKKYSADFTKVNFYEITELYEILKKIEIISENISNWKEELKKAIDFSNEEQFNKLLMK